MSFIWWCDLLYMIWLLWHLMEDRILPVCNIAIIFHDGLLNSPACSQLEFSLNGDSVFISWIDRTNGHISETPQPNCIPHRVHWNKTNSCKTYSLMQYLSLRQHLLYLNSYKQMSEHERDRCWPKAKNKSKSCWRREILIMREHWNQQHMCSACTYVCVYFIQNSDQT